MKKIYFIKAIWDEEASVWSVSDSDVPGLATSAPTIEALQAKLKVMIPELLELNAPETPRKAPIPYKLQAELLAYAR